VIAPHADEPEAPVRSNEAPVQRPTAPSSQRVERTILPKAAPTSSPSLSDEVAQLDRARDALVAGDATRALSILDAYERAKVGPTLSAEAALLRIEALVQRGEATRAATLATEFLRAHPQSPVADRMRSIIEAAPR
jgi:hypothetical protein